MPSSTRHLATLAAAALALPLTLMLAAVGCDGTVSSGEGSSAGSTTVDATPSADVNPLPIPEQCNGLDDDVNGTVDDGCSCTNGAVQSCWPGDPSNRNVGACHDGVQHCQGGQEFTHWSDCEGAVLPTTDIPGDGIDQDCDGGDGHACEPTGPEVCNDDIDNDCDGRTDCRDDDCSEFPVCSGDCVPDGPEVCGDNIDNDCDGLVDCDDVDDCYDKPQACTCVKQCPAGSVRWCDDPTYCRWGKQTCNPDGTWGACIETTERPAGCEKAYYYSEWCCVMTAKQCCQSLPSNNSVGYCPRGELVCEPR